MVFLLLVVSWLVVLLVMYLSSGRNVHTAELKVLLFFTSSARIILGPASGWTHWLRVFEGGGMVSAWGRCIFALSPYNLAVLQMLFPLIGLGQLAFTAVLMRSLVHFGVVKPRWYNPNRFTRTAMAVLTFRYGFIGSCMPRSECLCANINLSPLL